MHNKWGPKFCLLGFISEPVLVVKLISIKKKKNSCSEVPDLATHKDHNWPHHKLGCSLEEIPRADSISLILSGSDSEHSGILSLCLPASWLHVYAFAWVNSINIYCQLRVDAVTVSHMPVKSQLDQCLAHLRAVVFSPRGGLGVTSMLQCFRANSSPHHLGINLARCHASTHINWLELLIFISTDAGCSDKHTYVIASVRLVMMPCFDPQRIWMSAACGSHDQQGLDMRSFHVTWYVWALSCWWENWDGDYRFI